MRPLMASAAAAPCDNAAPFLALTVLHVPDSPDNSGARMYMDTSLIRKRPPLGPYSSICLAPYGVPSGGRGFL